jgi:hypothetical protein
MEEWFEVVCYHADDPLGKEVKLLTKEQVIEAFPSTKEIVEQENFYQLRYVVDLMSVSILYFNLE